MASHSGNASDESLIAVAFTTSLVLPSRQNNFLEHCILKRTRLISYTPSRTTWTLSSSGFRPLETSAPPSTIKNNAELPHCRRSKLVLTRRVFSWTLRRRLARNAQRPSPVESTDSVPNIAMPPPLETLLGERIPIDLLPIEAVLSPSEPVATFVLQRGHMPFPTRRRSGDPPSRFLRLSYAFVEPFSPNAVNCSNPRANGTLKGWYQIASRWNVLNTDFREPLILKPSQRVTVEGNQLLKRSHLSPASKESTTPKTALQSSNSDDEKPISPLLRRSRWERALGRSPRVIAIGDVHGCIDELQQLLRLADFQPGDQVVFLGDLVAKGPDSLGVVQLAREIGARSVRGNHDFEVVRWWEAHRSGNNEAMVSLEHARIARSLGEAEHTWLLECPWFIECAEMGHLFVHAGFIPGVKLTQQNPRLMMNMRSVLDDGTVTAKNVEQCEWAKLWQGPQTVVFGHDAVRGLQEYEFAKGIDTGCVYGGRLTALLLPENRLISVSAKRAYIAPKRFRATPQRQPNSW